MKTKQTKHKVVLTSDELFDAVGAYVLKKMNLSSLTTSRLRVDNDGEITFEFTDTSNKP